MQGEIEKSLLRLESYLPPKTLSPLPQQHREDYWTVPFCCQRGLEFTQHGPFLGVRVCIPQMWEITTTAFSFEVLRQRQISAWICSMKPCELKHIHSNCPFNIYLSRGFQGNYIFLYYRCSLVWINTILQIMLTLCHVSDYFWFMWMFCSVTYNWVHHLTGEELFLRFNHHQY